MANNTALWNRCVESFENATGDRQVAKVISLSLITGQPLLVVSAQAQQALVICIAEAFGGSAGEEDARSCDVRLFDDVTNESSAFFTHLQRDNRSEVSLVVGRVSPNASHTRDSVLDRFGLSVRFDGIAGSVRRGIISRNEILEMRRAASALSVSENLVEFAVSARRRCAPECWTGEVAEFMTYGASPRASVRLIEMVRVLAVGRGREANRDFMKELLEPVLMHRFGFKSNMPYDRFATGASLSASLASVL